MQLRSIVTSVILSCYNQLLSLSLTISVCLLSEMEASVVVSVSPKQQWSGSTGDPGYGRYSNVFYQKLSQCGVQGKFQYIKDLDPLYTSYDNIVLTELITEIW